MQRASNELADIIRETVRATVAAAVRETLRELRDTSLQGIPPESGVLTRKAAAKFVGIHPNALDRLVRLGVIKSHGKGRQRRFDIDDHLRPYLRGEVANG